MVKNYLQHKSFLIWKKALYIFFYFLILNGDICLSESWIRKWKHRSSLRYDKNKVMNYFIIHNWLNTFSDVHLIWNQQLPTTTFYRKKRNTSWNFLNVLFYAVHSVTPFNAFIVVYIYLLFYYCSWQSGK